MSHIALYRKWRPQTFADVVGQTHIIKTLQNSLQEGRYSHAYLFCGPRGTGKTSAAKLLAKAVNCERAPAAEPCNQCDACRRISAGTVMDVVEIDAASNRGVEEIRDLREKVKYAPTEVSRKVYIIDEVHMLTTEAFNALLKTLEEPPEHVMFILATTEPHKLPATIISRCQRFDFRRVHLEEQVARLQYICGQEGISADVEALQYVARLSDGGMRDAVSLLDQISSYSGERITCEHVVAMTGGMAAEQFKGMAAAIGRQDVGHVLELANALIQEGKSADKCMENLMVYFRDLVMVKLLPGSQVIMERILDPQIFAEVAEQYTAEQVFSIMDVLNHYLAEMKYASQPKTLFEVALIKICCLPASGKGGAVEAAGAGAQSAAGAAIAVEPPAARQPQPAYSLPPDETDTAALERRIAKLEQQLAQLAESAVPPAAGAAEPRKPLLQRTGGGAMPRKPEARLEAYAAERDSESSRQVKVKWHKVLDQVKQHKVTVHAWLVNGEPVSVSQDIVLLAFRNTMHKETTEKPANRQLIEQAMGEILGRPLKFKAVMQNDWQSAVAKPEASPLPGEEPLLQPEDEKSGKFREEWINEAIDLFGEDMVVISEDEG